MYLKFSNADPRSKLQIIFGFEVSSYVRFLDIKTKIRKYPILLTAGGYISSSNHITLFFNNQRLEDDRTVTSYGIASDSNIEYTIYDPVAYSHRQYNSAPIDEPVRRIQAHAWLRSSYVSPEEEEEQLRFADSCINYEYDPFAYGEGTSNNYKGFL